MIKFITWLIIIAVFILIMYWIQLYEESQEKECEDVGMVLVRPHNDKPYCTPGVRLNNDT